MWGVSFQEKLKKKCVEGKKDLGERGKKVN